MKKIDVSLNNFRENAGILQCTKCHEQVTIEKDTIVCSNNHQFQVNKKGTVNMALGKDQTISKYYDRNLFIARKYVQSQGFFKPLGEKLSSLIQDNTRLLDAGTGDGYFTNMVDNTSINIGVDLSKEAIHEAGNRQVSNTAYIVADLANLPLCDQSIDAIINVLSPANYKEFERVLSTEGKLIKVIPTKRYLGEIREYYSINSNYDNSDVGNLFHQRFSRVFEETISYEVTMDEALLEAVLVMTPLVKWSQNDPLPDIKKITCEFIILQGEKPHV